MSNGFSHFKATLFGVDGTTGETYGSNIDFNADDIGILLLNTDDTLAKTDADGVYAPTTTDIRNYQTVDDVLSDADSPTEITASPYSRKLLQNKEIGISSDTSQEWAYATADDVDFVDIDSSENIGSVLIFKQTSGATDINDDTNLGLVAHSTSDNFPVGPNGGTITIVWNTNGIMNIDNVSA